MPAGRIPSLDILRGFALLGILVMNIQSFAMIEAAYFNPTAYGDLTGINWWVWYLGRLLVDTKFMAIFSMLFGASTLLIAERAEAKGHRPLVIHTRRNLALLAVGWLHAHLLWIGDILFAYAICSFVIYPLRRRSPRTLFIVGGILLAIGSANSLAAGLTFDEWPAEEQAGHVEDWQPGPEAVAEELATYRGSWSEQNEHRTPSAWGMQTIVLLFYFLWRGAGMMLLGMGFAKLGVFRGERSVRFYANSIMVALLVGLPMVYWGVEASKASGWDAADGFFVSSQWNYWGSVAVAMGWVGVIMLLCRSAATVARLTPLGYVGRMAFTNYLMQTVLCTTIFYGHGLGLFGKLERIEQVGVMVGVWILQLIWSTLWLQNFRMGPAEWLWRWVTYGERPQLRGAALN